MHCGWLIPVVGIGIVCAHLYNIIQKYKLHALWAEMILMITLSKLI